MEVLPGFVHRDLKPENMLVGADQLRLGGEPAAGDRLEHGHGAGGGRYR